MMHRFLKRALSFAALGAVAFSAHAGPVIEYFEEASKLSKIEIHNLDIEMGRIQAPVVNRLLKGAKPITLEQTPVYLRRLFSDYCYDDAAIFTLEEDGQKLFFATQIPPKKQGTFLKQGSLTSIWRADGVSQWDCARGEGQGMRLVTLPKDTSKLWATLHDETVQMLETSRLELRGRAPLSRSKNPIGSLLEKGFARKFAPEISPAFLNSRIQEKSKAEKISLRHVPIFLRPFLQQVADDVRYYVIREHDQKIYYALPKGGSFPKDGKLTSPLYDDVTLWRMPGLRLATMPRGDGASLGKTLTTKALARLGVTREDFTPQKPARAPREKPAQPKTKPLSTAELNAHIEKRVQEEVKRRLAQRT